MGKPFIVYFQQTSEDIKITEFGAKQLHVSSAI